MLQIVFLNHLLKVSIFGSPLYSNLQSHEITHKGKKQTVLHLFSHRRLSELLKFGGLDATTFYKNGIKFICCAKVNLKKGEKNMIGYVIDETENALMVKVDGETELIRINRPTYDRNNGRYLYYPPCDQSSGTYSLSQLWPVRFKINVTGNSSFILSVTTLDIEQ